MDDTTEAAMVCRTGDMFRQTCKFNQEIIGLPIPAVPTKLNPERKSWALSALTEELTEFKDAETLEDEVDALIDLTYFALGRIVEMGIAPSGPFGEVQRANMQKRRGELSKRPGSKGFDAIKPLGWVAPSHADFLSLTSEEIVDAIKRRRSNEGASTTRRSAQLGDLYSNRKPRLLIMGHARHGKDTVCELLQNVYGYRFMSSSLFCAERIVLPAARSDVGMPFYADAQACFDDRTNHRKFWFDAITAYNSPDRTRLGLEIFAEYDVYCGIRNADEFAALKIAKAFDFAIWVDATKRAPSEGPESCAVSSNMADFVLDNNGAVEDLPTKLNNFMKGIIS